MQTAPQRSLYLRFLISRLPGWGSPLEKMRFFSKSSMIAGSSLQIGPTTSLSCSGEASTLGSYYLSGILKRLRKKACLCWKCGRFAWLQQAETRGDVWSNKTDPSLCWLEFILSRTNWEDFFADQMLPSLLRCTPVTRTQENTSLYFLFFFKIKLDSKVHGPWNIAGRCMEMEQRLLWTIAGGNEGSGRAAGTACSEHSEEACWMQCS